MEGKSDTNCHSMAYNLNLPFSDPLKNSRGYSGKAKASYPNGDTYEGDFVDGVSLNNLGGYHQFITV